MFEEKAMKKTLQMLIVLCLLIGPAGNILAADDRDKKPEEERSKSTPAKAEKTSAESNKFDEKTKEYLKKFRSLNAELLNAHRSLSNYNNLEKTQKSRAMTELQYRDTVSRELAEEGQTIINSRAKAEDRIRELQKNVEDLKNDLLKYYNGKLPKNVSEAWRTEEGFYNYQLSRIQ